MQDYFISIFYSEEDEGYIADIPDLRFCSAFGETAEEALREVQAAKAAWLETAHANGKPIPKPTYRPAIYHLETPASLAHS
jgi:predicted RNase H-like HicB family nuclease